MNIKSVLFSLMLICCIVSSSHSEMIYGKTRISAFIVWDISMGAHDPGGDIFIDLFDVPSVSPINGAGMLHLRNTEFHSVVTAPEDTTQYVMCICYLNNNATYVVRTTEGNYAKLHIGYFEPIDDQNNNIEWVYQTDGTTNLDYLTGVEESTWGAIKQIFVTE